MVNAPQLIPPPASKFFKVERLDAGQWRECTVGRKKWYRVRRSDPLEVAPEFGAGTYRVVWTGEDKRNSQQPSEPFEVGAELETEDQPPAPPPTEKHPTDQPTPDESTGPPSAPREPAPQKPPKRKPNRYDMPTMDPAAMVGSVLHPLGQFVYLEAMSSAKSDKFQAVLLQGMQMMIANERARSEEHIAQVRAHYAELNKSREQFVAAMMAMNAARDKPNGELAEVKNAIARLGEQMDDLADDEVPELDPVKLAQLSENPTDLERALTAVQNVIGVVANSPIGNALAERLRETGPPLYEAAGAPMGPPEPPDPPE
jgi:predicted negative regulator of RcsB-dependent stress response